MDNLQQQTCAACQSHEPPVAVGELAPLLTQAPGWKIDTKEGVNQLVQHYSFSNFQQALAFTNRVGELAEHQNHHPSLLTEWGKVTVIWWTHRIKGLHKNDFIMAAKTNQLFAELTSTTD